MQPRSESKFRRKSSFQPKLTNNATLESVIKQMRDQLTYEQSQGRGNLTFAERRALDDLSVDNQIVINKADKANAIVVQNHTDYAADGFQHLGDTAVYKELSSDTTLDVEHAVVNFVKKLYKDGLINKEMADFCLPNKLLRTARIYFLKKTHKTPMGIRPVVSGINCPTENLSQFVDVWLQPIMSQLPSFVRDSTQFINTLEGMTFPPDCLLASIDVTSLYTNILHTEGIDCAISALQQAYERDPDHPPPTVIGEMIKIVLMNNVIEFEGHFYLQIQGCAMGTRLAPSYASIFMGHMEVTLQAMAGAERILLWRRYIDDIILFYRGEREQFDQYMVNINQIHPTIKFTSECSPQQVTFLDLTVYKGERFERSGVLDVKTYVKACNKQLYVHAKSYHPKGTGKGIIIGEALRYLRTNSDQQHSDQMILKHKKILHNRGYNPEVSSRLIEPITFTERQTILSKQAKLGVEGVEQPITFVTTFNDSVREVRRIVCDLWPTLRADATLAALSLSRPLFALRRNKTIANRVVKAKHAPIFADHTIYKGDGNAPFRLESSELLTTVPLVPIYSDTYAATEPVPPKSATKVSDGTHPSSSGSALMHNGVQLDLGSGEKRVDMPLFGGGPDPKRPGLHPDDERMLAMYQPHGLGGAAPRGIGPREPCGRGHVSDVLGPDHWAPRVSGLAPLIGERHAGGGGGGGGGVGIFGTPTNNAP